MERRFEAPQAGFVAPIRQRQSSSSGSGLEEAKQGTHRPTWKTVAKVGLSEERDGAAFADRHRPAFFCRSKRAHLKKGKK
jgi:hypothetical protein